jgi:hypothetical protein
MFFQSNNVLTDSRPQNVPDERREATRHQTRFGEATLESDIFLEKVPVIDIGRLGFSVLTSVSYPQGCRLVLQLSGHDPLPARSVWHSRNRLGARFDAPLDLASLLNLIGED